jgi:hypothetical protein
MLAAAMLRRDESRFAIWSNQFFGPNDNADQVFRVQFVGETSNRTAPTGQIPGDFHRAEGNG